MGVFIDNTWYEKKTFSQTRFCAGGVVLRKEGTGIYVALVREEPYMESFLPKGKLEKKESSEEAARREIKEEAGISELKLIRFLNTCGRYDLRKKHWKSIDYFLFETEQKEAIPADKNHKYSLLWADINSEMLLLWPEQKKLIDDIAQNYRKGGIQHGN